MMQGVCATSWWQPDARRTACPKLGSDRRSCPPSNTRQTIRLGLITISPRPALHAGGSGQPFLCVMAPALAGASRGAGRAPAAIRLAPQHTSWSTAFARKAPLMHRRASLKHALRCADDIPVALARHPEPSPASPEWRSSSHRRRERGLLSSLLRRQHPALGRPWRDHEPRAYILRFTVVLTFAHYNDHGADHASTDLFGRRTGN